MKIQVRKRESLTNIPFRDAHVVTETIALEEIDIDIAAMTAQEILASRAAASISDALSKQIQTILSLLSNLISKLVSQTVNYLLMNLI